MNEGIDRLDVKIKTRFWLSILRYKCKQPPLNSFYAKFDVFFSRLENLFNKTTTPDILLSILNTLILYYSVR